MRRMPQRRCSGARGMSICIVEQLGLAMIISPGPSTLPLISGTTNGTPGSILQQEELSTTRQPTAAKRGASSRETEAPAENRAMSGRAARAVSAPTTCTSEPAKRTDLPTDFSEATGSSSVTGKCLSSKTFSITEPTNPVAPTTATLIVRPSPAKNSRHSPDRKSGHPHSQCPPTGAACWDRPRQPPARKG